MTNQKLELTPDNCQVILIDQQPQMAFGIQANEHVFGQLPGRNQLRS